MTAQAQKNTDASPAFEIRGTNFMLPVLQLLESDIDAISRGLEDKVASAPQLFQNAPVVIDLQGLATQAAGLDLPLLIGLLRSSGLIPVGVSGGNEKQNEIAGAMELAVLSNGAPQKRRQPKAAARPERTTGGRTVTQPVRSGQRVYAPGGDLVVLGSVSSGAEVFADGNIHIYGALRGRALAGVKGRQDARIFCRDLSAELVSVAGIYKVSEDMHDDLRGQAVQIYLNSRHLHIDTL